MAYRMLGSLGEVDDGVQEAGCRSAARTRARSSTVSLRKARREEPEVAHVPDPIVTRDSGSDPEHQVLLADSIGLALIVVTHLVE